jgi:hypothetical protein
MDRIFTTQSRIRWKEVENNIKIKTFTSTLTARVKNIIAILKKYDFSEVLEKVEEKKLIGERWRIINEELRKLPSFKKLREMKSGSIKDIYDSLKRNDKKLSLLRILQELEILSEFDLVEKKFNEYQALQN